MGRGGGSKVGRNGKGGVKSGEINWMRIGGRKDFG